MPRTVSRRSLRRIAVAALWVATSLVGATPAAAQASYVSVDVRTTPAIPQPGDDVTVTARVSQCPPGASLVQVLLSSNDADTTTAALMAEALARTSLLWRTRAVIDLPDAIEGWYGIRVQCGTFVPDHVPMANTYFAVGANPVKEARLSADRVEEGATLTYSGTGCPGSTVEYQVQQYTGRVGTFVPTGSIPVRPDGSWSADILFNEKLPPGLATVSARCTILNRYGQVVYITYGRPAQVTLLRAGEGGAAPMQLSGGAAPATTPGG